MKKKIEKEFLGQTFSYRAEIDENGNVLWDDRVDKEFSKWLHQLRDENRELFKVQYSISSNAYEVLNKLKESIGAYDDSLLVRAITITFINFIDTRGGRAIIEKLKSYKDSDDFKVLQEGSHLKKSLYFSPVGMRDVEAYANLTDLKKSQVVKNALYSVLLISINEDKEMREFWENEILREIKTIVKAA